MTIHISHNHPWKKNQSYILCLNLDILFSINSILSLTENIVIKKHKLANAIMNNGMSMLSSMLGDENLEIDAGWCNVFHQSTENFIIGTFINPIIASTAEIFEARTLLEIACHKKI